VSITVFKPAGVTVDVRDNPPSSGGSGAAAGDVTVFKPAGMTLAVVDEPDVLPTIHAEPMNLSALVALDGWNANNGNYTRRMENTVLEGASASLRFQVKMSATRTLLATTYTLRIFDSADSLKLEVACPVAAGAKLGTFTVPLTDLPEGWYRLQLIGAPSESCPTWFAYRYIDGSHVPALIPVCSGNYEVIHYGRAHKWAWVPNRYQPTARPKAARTYDYFDQAVPYTQLYRELLVPVRLDDIHRPNVDRRGIVSTFNRQPYEWDTFYAKYPRVALLDGPRGVGSLSMLAHAMGSLRPDSLKIYFCDPWRFGRIDEDGTITTLVGYRHKTPPGHYETDPAIMPANLELVGDWSAVPESLRGLHECWGAAWWKRSVLTDPNAPPIGGEQPHLVGPVCFLTSPQTGCVFRVEFSATDRSAPARVTVFASGLADPWDVVEDNDVVYISERFAHRISKWDAATGASLGNLVQGPDLARWTRTRGVVRSASVDTIRTQTCVGPEGLYILDGVLTFGSNAMRQAKNIDLATGAISHAFYPTILSDAGANFVKVARSDGTFGPRGAYFSTRWSNGNLGMPEAFLPDGTKWKVVDDNIKIAQGRGGNYASMGYDAAVGVSHGRMLSGASNEGLVVTSLAKTTDPAVSGALYLQGKKEYYDKGRHLLHGDGAFGFLGYATPAGDTAAEQYYIANNI
jgi:hypothetical protein